MSIERSKDNKLVITLPENLDSEVVQRVIDFFRYFELASGSKATQEDADRLAEESNAAWLKNRKKNERP
ncbi:MAG: hypothetical protein H6601_12895 [Flavobacteriales bacterium]|nr:hypothetical protein [Flavobacteriales bacterium]MCB9187629.1 hypothetical protein [Flavobacteriales bacterium]